MKRAYFYVFVLCVGSLSVYNFFNNLDSYARLEEFKKQMDDENQRLFRERWDIGDDNDELKFINGKLTSFVKKKVNEAIQEEIKKAMAELMKNFPTKQFCENILKCKQGITKATTTKPPAAYDSCKAIKANNPSATSGSYYINLWNATLVYCDMETDGGGWTRIGRVQNTTKADTINNIISGNLADLNKAASQNFLLSGELYPTLQSYIKFHEFRVFCTKPYHDRKHHASFSDRTTPESKWIFDYVMGTRDYVINTCNGLKYMPDDNSVTRFSHCGDNKFEQTFDRSKKLYESIWYIERKTSLHIKSDSMRYTRMTCDDIESEVNGFDKLGTWLFYVR